MKVAHILDTSSRRGGGIAESVKGFTTAIAAAGGDVAVIAGTDEWTATDLPNWGAVQPHVVTSTGLRDNILAQALVEAVATVDPDVLHVHGLWGPAARATAAWSRRTGKPVVLSPHGMLDEWALRRSVLKKRISQAFWEGHVLREAAFIHALNDAEAASIEAAGWSRPIAIIANGVAMPAPAGETDGRRRKALLFLGRLHPKKGLAELVQAWSLLPAALRDDWVLRIAGWDEIGTLAALQAQSATLGLGDGIEFLGPIYGVEKEAAFRDATAFILPSHSEGLPVVILEAWSYGLPVMMTRACNLPEGFTEGAAVEVSTDPAAMAGVMTEALSDAGALRATGARGRVLVERDHAWPSIATAMLRAYAQGVS